MCPVKQVDQSDSLMAERTSMITILVRFDVQVINPIFVTVITSTMIYDI